MKTYSICNPPFRVYGIPHFDQTKTFERLPKSLRDEVPSLSVIGRRITGARVGFRTDSEKITLRMEFEPAETNPGMSLHASASAYVFIGSHTDSRYAALVSVEEYGATSVEKTFIKRKGTEDILILLPRDLFLKKVEVELEDNALLEAPTPYSFGPVVIYGSSIVEAACPASGYNSYPQMLSRFLDCDYYNFGFSGNARAELPIADFMMTLPMQAFILDYDYNAKDEDYLRQTHESFFLYIRERMPDLPILIMSKPDIDYHRPYDEVRREIVAKTYQNAIARGDKKVWFIDGETLFGDADRQLCTVDRIHPNDLGFYRMAKTIAPVLQKMLAGESNS